MGHSLTRLEVPSTRPIRIPYLCGRNVRQAACEAIEGKERNKINRTGDDEEWSITVRMLQNLSCHRRENHSTESARSSCRACHGAHFDLRKDVRWSDEHIGGETLMGGGRKRNDKDVDRERVHAGCEYHGQSPEAADKHCCLSAEIDAPAALYEHSCERTTANTSHAR